MTVVIACDDRARFIRDACFGLLRRQRTGPIIDIRENGRSAGKNDCVRGLAPGVGRSDDLIPRADAVGLQHEEHAHRTARNRNGVFPAAVSCESPLECLGGWSRADPRRPKNLAHGLNFGGRYMRVR